MLQNPHVLLTFDKVHNPLRLPRETTSERPKVIRTCQFFTRLTRNVLRATTVCTFRRLNFQKSPNPSVFSTFDLEMCFTPQPCALFRRLNFQKCPNPSVFCTFDLEMCFAPQWRALFRHVNFQKWSEHGMFCTFCLPNVLRAIMACTFLTCQLPKVAPSMVCFVHFDFQMCFAPQQRATFHLSSDHMAPHPPL